MSHSNLSTFRFPPKAARAAGYLPGERRLILARAPVIIDDRAVHASSAALQYMRINHRGADIAVAEKFLNRNSLSISSRLHNECRFWGQALQSHGYHNARRAQVPHLRGSQQSQLA